MNEKTKTRSIGILTAGGDCPGLNPAIRGTVMRAQDHGYECIGILEGWKGLIESKKGRRMNLRTIYWLNHG